MNTGDKGRRAEKRCEDELKKEGLLTWRVRRGKFGGNDVFDLFDVLALKEDGSGPTLMFVQVKSNRVDKKTIEKIRAIKLPSDCYKYIYIWHDREGAEWKEIW